MTSSIDESSLERVTLAVMRLTFWAASVTLTVGLALWLALPAGDDGALWLNAGLLCLLLMPLLRLVRFLATAIRQRDWLLLVAALAVLGILGVLTLRDAAMH
jgi:hypothetical protein